MSGGVGVVPEPDSCPCSAWREEGGSESAGPWVPGAASSTERPPCCVHIQEGRPTQRCAVQGNVEMWQDSRTVSTLSSVIIASKLVCILWLQLLMIWKPSHTNGEVSSYKYHLYISSDSLLLTAAHFGQDPVTHAAFHWSRELVITTGELELGSCTSSSPLVIKDGGGSWFEGEYLAVNRSFCSILIGFNNVLVV